MEKILGFLIIPAIQKEVPKHDIVAQNPIATVEVEPSTNPLLNKTVKHWIYGEGKIIKIVGDRMTVQFAKKQEEYGQESLKNGFLKLVDTQKPKIAPSTPRTYAPNIPEIKQVVKPIVSKSITRETVSPQKHRWTYEENKTCCRIFIETYITNCTDCPIDALAAKILTIYPHIKYSSIKMNLQNIKRICLDYGIKDSSTISPLDNYSNQNLQAMKEELLAVGITI
jgi:hypothetical protein